MSAAASGDRSGGAIESWPGQPAPLGATWDGEGTNFALFSGDAEAVELCLFDERGERRVPVRARENQVWHVYLPGVGPGQQYGYRVHGPYRPERGLRFNPHKLLLDPYARAIAGRLRLRDEHFAYPLSHRGPERGEDLVLDTRDSAPVTPKCLVVDPSFDWQGDAPPRVPAHQTVIYEAHVKGMTALHPEVPEPHRGTYLGLCAPPVIEHLRGLGVTAVELLPVHQSADEHHLVRKDLSNYWGYSSIGFFAPDARFATAPLGQQVSEFKTMVRELHRAGIEVLLDVVYNHTPEGDRLGPTLCFRGIDNLAYYHVRPHEPRIYRDATGCGNTVRTDHPRGLQLVMDSLRYWVEEMHVDGFRFDLAPALARASDGAVRAADGFFAVVQQDPVLSRVKLIAEPWDLGEGGYRVGGFPAGWAEWNGKYRDTVRRFWRGDGGVLGELASRLTGSSDLYGGDRPRTPSASINYVTAHDGFTLHDLVRYERKHNEANGEGNRDGTDANYSRNWGVEGETDDPAVEAVRERVTRSLLATLLCSQGIPMVLMGDEVGRTQRGNNNAYCQDNRTSWMRWDLTPRQRSLLEFTRRAIQLRREQPVLWRRAHFDGEPISPKGTKDLTWLRPDGAEMTRGDWIDGRRHCLAVRIDGRSSDVTDERGRRFCGDTLLLLLNGSGGAQEFTLPTLEVGEAWTLRIDTGAPHGGAEGGPATRAYRVAAHALVVLSSPCPAGGQGGAA